MKVITTKNVYTSRTMDLCETHFEAQANGDAQVQHGLHAGECDACAAKMANDYPRLTQAQLDAIAVHMDDDIREDLHSAAEWQHPGEFLTAYLEADPGFPVKDFDTDGRAGI